MFGLSQTLRQQWLTGDYAAKGQVLEIICLNCTLDGATLVSTMRKPFDVFAEGLLSKNSRGDWIRTSDLLNPIQEPQQPNPLPAKPVTSNPQTACTSACTSEAKNEQTDPLAMLAAAVKALSAEDRARLATLLVTNAPGAAPGSQNAL